MTPQRLPRRDPGLLQRAAIAAALLLPTTAWACGACSDASLLRRYWWINLPLASFLPIFLEAILCAVYCMRVAKRDPRMPGVPLLIGAGLAVPAALLTGLSMNAISFVIGLAFIAAFIQSLWLERSLGPVVVLVRLGLVLASSAYFGQRFLPTGRETGQLVQAAVLKPDNWDLQPTNWLEEELLRRPDAPRMVHAFLLDPEVGRGDSVTSRALAMARLDFLLGGSAAARSALCRRFPDTPVHGLGPDERARICATSTAPLPSESGTSDGQRKP